MAATLVVSTNVNVVIPNGTRGCVRTSTGIPYVVLFDSTDDKIEVWKGNSVTPTSFTEKDTANSPVGATYGSISAAIDGNGIIHIVWCEYISKSDDLEYIQFDTGDDTFKNATTINADLGAESTTVSRLFTSIAIDSNNIPHVAYVGVESNAGTFGQVVRYENRIGGVWNGTGVEVEGQTGNKNCLDPDITINASNIPIISYVNSDDDVLSRAVGNTNDATSFTLVDLGPVTIDICRTSICIDSGGTIYVASLDVHP